MTADRGRGRPAVGKTIAVRLPDRMVELLDLEAEIHDMARAELVRNIVGEWLAQGYPAEPPAP